MTIAQVALIIGSATEGLEQYLEFLTLAARNGFALGEEVVVEGVSVSEGAPALLAQPSSGMAVLVICDIKGRDRLSRIVDFKVVGWSAKMAPRTNVRREELSKFGNQYSHYGRNIVVLSMAAVVLGVYI